LKKVEVVVDCTPKGIGAKNKPIYEKARVKAIFQGSLLQYYRSVPGDACSAQTWMDKKGKSRSATVRHRPLGKP
jgi:hypothetical protein